jgi:hypothetical protein
MSVKTITADGDQFWLFKGEFHREDGPAYIGATGTKIWYKHGLYHRLDGPAIEWTTGEKAWYINGEDVMVDSQEEFDRFVKLKAFW